jgi:nucleotide-binding universal stress UspA family protein
MYLPLCVKIRQPAMIMNSLRRSENRYVLAIATGAVGCEMITRCSQLFPLGESQKHILEIVSHYPEGDTIMKTIIVPLDGSALAEQALPYARALAALTGAQIHLMQAIPEQRVASVYTPMLAEAYAAGSDPSEALEHNHMPVMATLQSQAAMYLAEQAQALRTNAITVDIETYIGDPAEMIVEIAETKPAAWVVMATHGYSGLRRWTLGSVTDKVVQAASVPVLIVRSSPVAPPAVVKFRNILVPLDGSELSQQALPLAVELAKANGALLTLVRAISPTADVWAGTGLAGLPPIPYDDVYEALHTQARSELEAIADDLSAQGLRVNTVVESAIAADAIIAEAHHCKADLVVMATHGRGGLRRWTLGSVADKVLHATITPLLLVRARHTI